MRTYLARARWSGERGELTAARLALRSMLVGVVARAHERPGGDVIEPQRVRRALERGELVGVPVAHDGQVLLRRTQVLPDGEDLDTVLAQDPERLDELVVRLAQADHQARLRRDRVPAHLLRVAQHATRAQERRAATCHGIQARDDLDVVVEDVRALGDDLRQRHLLAAEVGREHLDLAPGRLAADLADDAHEGAGAVVGEVVAVDARDDGVAQPHLRHRPRHAGRLERVVPRRLAGLDVAEAAAARARVAEDHERGGAAVPAVADVRTRRLLADGVQVLVADEAVELAVARAARRLHLEPWRLAVAEGQDVRAKDLEDVHPARVRPGSGLVLARGGCVGTHASGIYRG